MVGTGRVWLLDKWQPYQRLPLASPLPTAHLPARIAGFRPLILERVAALGL